MIIHDWIDAMRSEMDGQSFLLNIVSSYMPSNLSVIFTRACNFRCKHCFYPPANQEDLKLGCLGRIDKVIGAAHSSGITLFTHCGRNLLPEQIPILSHYHQQGMDIHLIDNGTGARLLPRLTDAGLRFVSVDISIDGDKAAHTHHRGATWEEAVKGAEQFQSITDRLSVISVASSLNCSTIINGIEIILRTVPNLDSLILTTYLSRDVRSPLNLGSARLSSLFDKFLCLPTNLPVRLAIWDANDIAAIIDHLLEYPVMLRHTSLRWRISDNLFVEYFPRSIGLAENYLVDADGMLIANELQALQYHLLGRPTTLSVDPLTYAALSDAYQSLVLSCYPVYLPLYQQEQSLFHPFFS